MHVFYIYQAHKKTYMNHMEDPVFSTFLLNTVLSTISFCRLKHVDKMVLYEKRVAFNGIFKNGSRMTIIVRQWLDNNNHKDYNHSKTIMVNIIYGYFQLWVSSK